MNLKEIVLKFILFFFSLLVANIIVLIFFDLFFKQKFISQKLLRIAPTSKTFLYSDTYKTLNEYNLIIGDSYVLGLGDSFLNLDYDFSIGHHLYNLSNKGESFINIGMTGAGSKISFLYAEDFVLKKKHPKNILFFFYEGNDLTDNIYYEKSINEKKIKLRIFFENYFPLFIFIRNAIQYYSGEKTKAKENLQSPAMELNDDELKLAINSFFETILKLKKISKNISIVYIPSPATLSSKKQIYVKNYFKKENQAYSKLDIENKSIIIKNLINDFSINNEISFLDTTKVLKDNSNREDIYGPKDFSHLNKYGYETISRYIFENFKYFN